MKLLILTQKLDKNDDLLGFFHGWAAEFAKHCEKATVIALGAGEYDLPGNVKVLSLGKEKAGSKFKRVGYLLKFYKYIWQERQNYDAVFVHMNKEYVILGGWYWRLLGKRIAFWYVHKQAGPGLRLAEKMANVIFTASPESFNLKSAKLKIIGHGIDLAKFSHEPEAKNNKNFKIIYVGRISQIKNQKLLIEAANILVNTRGVKNIKVDLVGGPVFENDNSYKNELTERIRGSQLENFTRFSGSVPNKDLADIYAQADLSVNLSPTGGMDKAVLESMAAGLPVIAYNKTFSSLLAGHDDLLLKNLEAGELAGKITELMKLLPEQRRTIGLNLRNKIIQDYGLANLINKIVDQLSRGND